MSRPKEVEITKDGVTGSVLEVSFVAWERNGWTRVDDGDVAPDEPADPTSPVEHQDEPEGDQPQDDTEHEGEDQ